MLVLTGEIVGGAVLYERDVWEHGVGFLASVDLATGTFRKEKGFLRWLGERGQEKFGGRKIKPLKIYHVRCRKKAETEEEKRHSGKQADCPDCLDADGNRGEKRETSAAETGERRI